MLALAPTAVRAQDGGCILCAAAVPSARETPLAIEVTTNLAFSRLALTGRGDASASVDPQSGTRRVGSGMVDLGGVTVQGRGRITGAPGRSVRVDLPAAIQMTAPGGGLAELTNLTTDLPAFPVLDAGGSLEFSFGGEMRVAGPTGGQFRGRIPITVDYN